MQYKNHNKVLFVVKKCSFMLCLYGLIHLSIYDEKTVKFNIFTMKYLKLQTAEKERKIFYKMILRDLTMYNV